MTRFEERERARSSAQLAGFVEILLPGDRVQVIRDSYYFTPIPAGAEGTAEGYISYITHATSNGGGYDVPVQLDDGRKVTLRAGGGHASQVTRIGVDR